MIRVTCALKLPNNDRPLDFELPAEVPSEELVELILTAIDLGSSMSSRFRLRIGSAGVELNPKQTLANASVMDGDLLFMVPSQSRVTLISQTREYPIRHSEIYLGRLPQISAASGDRLVGVAIDLSGEPEGRTVSKIHARLSIAQNGWTIEHLAQASNPTWLNDEELTEGQATLLHAKDVIRLGDLELEFDIE